MFGWRELCFPLTRNPKANFIALNQRLKSVVIWMSSKKTDEDNKNNVSLFKAHFGINWKVLLASVFQSICTQIWKGRLAWLYHQSRNANRCALSRHFPKLLEYVTSSSNGPRARLALFLQLAFLVLKADASWAELLITPDTMYFPKKCFATTIHIFVALVYHKWGWFFF